MIKERFKCILEEAVESFFTTTVPLLLIFTLVGYFVSAAWYPTPTILAVFILADIIFGCGVAKERFKKPD